MHVQANQQPGFLRWHAQQTVIAIDFKYERYRLMGGTAFFVNKDYLLL